jgi:UDP-N-acetylglucosamine 3-dehydrogenase
MGRHHARVLSEIDSSNLIAVVDSNELAGRAIAEEQGATYYSSLDALLGSESIDAVSIAVPTGAHEAVATQFIEANVAVLIEKPIASSIEGAQRLVDLAASRRVPLAIGHIERFNPALRLARDLVRRGTLGEIISLTSRRLGPVPPARQTTDVILDLAVHDLDLVSFLLGGSPSIVHAKGGKTDKSLYEDWADITLVSGEASCFLQVSWTVPIKIRKISITGTEGYIEVNNVSQTVDFFEAIDWREAADFNEFVELFGEPQKKRYNAEPVEPLKLELESFLSSVSSGEPLEVPGEVGIQALELALEVRDRVRGQAG